MRLTRIGESVVWIMLAATVIALSAVCNAKADTAKAGSPTWVAFIAQSAEHDFMNDAPLFIVYSDGKAIWRDTKASTDTDKEDPAQWRTGTVSAGTMSSFRINIEPSAFFTIPKPSSETADNSLRAGLPATHIGVQFGTKQRIIGVTELPDEAGQSALTPWVSTAMAVRDAILALKPATSTTFTPDKINLIVVPAPSGVTGVPWPLATPPATDSNSYFSGSDIAPIIHALADNFYVTFGGKTYKALWVPMIPIPAAPGPTVSA